jgi:hypothetical protein
MPRAREARLARIVTHSTAPDTAALWHQTTLRARVKVGAALREALAKLEIDPAKVPMLGVADTAAEELANEDHAPAGTVPLAEGYDDGATDDAGAETFGSSMSKLVRRYRDRHDIDFAQASLAEALAWCVARLE